MQIRIQRFGPVIQTWHCCYNDSSNQLKIENKLTLISQSLAKWNGWFYSSVRSPASPKQCIEVVLHIALKQSYCEILESVPAVFAKLSWNFHLSLSCCSALAGNWQYITGFVDLWYWILLCLFPALRSHFPVSYDATYCARRYLTSHRPECAAVLSHARVCRCHILCETVRAPLQAPQYFDECEPKGLSLRCQLLLLASHCTALTRECKNPSQIAREIKFFSNFAWCVPTHVLKHTSRFQAFHSNFIYI